MPMAAEVLARGAQHVQAVREAEFASADLDTQSLNRRFLAELSGIYALPKVRDLRVLPGVLLVYTGELTAASADGKRYDIGRFLIQIKLRGSDAGVRWFNASRRVDAAGRSGMNAPYVYADGSPSNDAVLVTIMEMIGRCELAALVDVAIQYVETIDANNPLTEHLESWGSGRGLIRGLF